MLRHAVVENLYKNIQTFIHFKFMICIVCKCDKHTRDAAFSGPFIKTLKKLIILLFCSSEVQHLDTMTSFPLFMKDMLSVMNPGNVFEVVRIFC